MLNQCICCGKHSQDTVKRNGYHRCPACKDKTLFLDLPIGARFKVVKYRSYSRFDLWIKIAEHKNGAYPNLDANAEKVHKNDQGDFAPGDKNWTWVNAGYEIKEI